jgi:pimeloyl-ACP methyl ester carboxylesterase
MFCDQQFLWISTNPSLQCFHRHILNLLGREFSLKYWEYTQTPDEPGSLEVALSLLHEYIQTSDQPVHLIGHGLGGVLALSYARRYPDRVASLVLISVAVQPSVTWQTYYYHHLAQATCSRDFVLQVVASWLFRISSTRYIQHLADRLDRDLLEAPSNTSLLQKDQPLSQGSILQPLLVCGAADDPVLMGDIFTDWSHHLKPEDRLYHHHTGGHFFHHQYADEVGIKIINFWRQLTLQRLQCVLPKSIGVKI